MTKTEVTKPVRTPMFIPEPAPSTEAEALRRCERELLELFLHLQALLQPSDPRVSEAFDNHEDFAQKVNVLTAGTEIAPIEPGRAQRIAEKLDKLRRARAAAAAVEELTKLATDLVGEFA